MATSAGAVRRESTGDSAIALIGSATAEARWLDDFALFMAVKDAHGQVAWIEWEQDIAARDPSAVARWSTRLAREIRLYKLTQFLFFDQWARLRRSLSQAIDRHSRRSADFRGAR